MRFLTFAILFFLQVSNSYSQHFEVSGKVYSDAQLAIENVHVLVKGTSIGVYTDKNGFYTIKVKAGDILSFSYLGMDTVEIHIEKGFEILDVELSARNESLDSVFIKKESPDSQVELSTKYQRNKNLIKSAQGMIDKDRASFAIRIIDGDQLVPFGSDFLYSLQNMYPVMQVDRTDENIHDPKVYLQNWSHGSKPSAIFDVDGIIYEKAPTFLMANDIDRIAILVRNGAVARYGPAGAGGVIIINTKSFIPKMETEEAISYDNSGLRDSIYDAINKPIIYDLEVPYYLKELSEAKTNIRARKLFDQYKVYHKDSPDYLIDAASFFLNTWKDQRKAMEILALIRSQYASDISVLRSVAFVYEEMNKEDLVFEVYLKIFNLMPKHAQSHRDISNTYVKLGNYKRALNRYLNYESIVRKLDSIDFSNVEVEGVMKTESANIIKMQGDNLAISDKIIDNMFESPNTRLLLEWNNDQTAFEIRIVNADGSYYSWEQNKSKDNVVKQFFLDEDFRETKHIQIVYDGNESDNPLYLKVSLFFNYGKHNQRTESKVYRISEKNINYRLLSFNNYKTSIMN